MTRNLMALGTALLAVIALGATIASGAQAKFDTLKTDPTVENAILTAEADATGGTQTFLIAGLPVGCSGISIQPGGSIADKATQSTVHPEYTSCKISGVINTTVKTEGCNYLFTGETTSNTTGEKEDATVHVECEAGKAIKIGPTLGCEISIPEQTVHGVHYKNVETGTGTRELHVTLEATGMNIKVITKGCMSLLGLSDGEHEGAEYTGNTTVKGFEDLGHE